MNRIAFCFVASLVLAAGAGSALAEETTAPKDASLRFVTPHKTLTGISYGLSAVDMQALILDQRTTAHVASGRRTVWYTCPGEATMTGGSRITFDFKAGELYELQCRGGQQAQIVPAEGC